MHARLVILGGACLALQVFALQAPADLRLLELETESKEGDGFVNAAAKESTAEASGNNWKEAGDDDAFWLLLRAGAGLGRIEKVMTKACDGESDCKVDYAKYEKVMMDDLEKHKEKFLDMLMIRREIPALAWPSAKKKAEQTIQQEKANASKFMWEVLNPDGAGTIDLKMVQDACSRVANERADADHMKRNAIDLFLYSCSECSKGLKLGKKFSEGFRDWRKAKPAC